MIKKYGKKAGGIILCCGAAALLSACASARFGSSSLPANAGAGDSNGAPLGQISQTDLPPPAGAEMAASATGAPMMGGASGDLSALPQPDGAVSVTPAAVSGVWTAVVNGMQCRLVTPQTKAGQGYRAAAPNCPSLLAQVGSWNVSGKQLLLYDKSGKNLAVLYSGADSRFVGRARGGAALALHR